MYEGLRTDPCDPEEGRRIGPYRCRRDLYRARLNRLRTVQIASPAAIKATRWPVAHACALW